MQKTFLIVCGILVLAFSVSTFSYYLGKQSVPALKIPLEKSKLIQLYTATAEGEVVEIEEEVLILAAEGDILEIPLKEKVGVIALIFPEEKTEPELKFVTSKEIKVGDRVRVEIKIEPERKLEGTSVVILPPLPPVVKEEAGPAPQEVKLTPEEERARLEKTEETLNEWLPMVLKPEYLPEKLEVKQVPYLEPFKVICLFECLTEEDSNLYQGEWKISDKSFGAYLDYNNEKNGINYYLLHLIYFEKEELNENLAQEILKQYLLSEPKIDFCDFDFEGDEVQKSVIGCRGGKIKLNGDKEDFIIFSIEKRKGEEREFTIMDYYLRPIESEMYKLDWEMYAK